MIFNVYKRSQGTYTRLCSCFGIVLIAGIGCLQLYKELQAGDIGLWTETMIPAGLFVGLSVLVLWLANKPAVADFMIASESELKKVNWSSRKEVAVSTITVIIVVVFFAILFFFTDLGLRLFFDRLL